jgi:hypothetical protein
VKPDKFEGRARSTLRVVSMCGVGANTPLYAEVWV